MPELSFAFSRTWTVRLPVLVRQMHTQYVEDFFRDGSLRLSSFESFRKHPDESRRDGQEGFVAMEMAAPDGTLNVLGANSQEAYIISASTVEAAPQAPGSEYSSFRITNTLGFADAVSRQIPGFLGGVEGHCIYRDNTFIRKADTRSVAPPASGVDAERWFAEQQSYVGKQAIDAYFVKHVRFAHEAEYRFIWFAEGAPREFIDIKCPAAIQFCERL